MHASAGQPPRTILLSVTDVDRALPPGSAVVNGPDWPLLRAAAVELFGSVPDIAREMADLVYEAIPDLTLDDHPDVNRTVREAVDANVSALVESILRETPLQHLELRTETSEASRIRARQGVPLTSVLRSYRMGQAYFLQVWTRKLAQLAPPDQLAEATIAAGTYLFDWFDHLCDLITAAYQDEYDRVARTAAVSRAGLIERLLAGDGVDAASASRTLGYELERDHVAAILWVDDPDRGSDVLSRLDRAAQLLAQRCSSARPLVMPADTNTVWAWLGAHRESSAAALDDVSLEPEVWATVGTAARGVEGFRSSHHQAREARRIVLASKRRRGRVTSYRSVELPSLCAQDLELTRAFVRRELGALVADDDTMARLRSTLLVFFEEGSNFRKAARRLGIHHNTVIYRVRQAEKLLGHDSGTRRLHLELALYLAQTLRPAVLEPPSTAHDARP